MRSISKALQVSRSNLAAKNKGRVIQWLSDNGSCYTAKETVKFGKNVGLDIRTTPPYSPESNGMSEAFVKTFKRDYVWVGKIRTAQEVVKQLPKWFEDYNEKAPHYVRMALA